MLDHPWMNTELDDTISLHHTKTNLSNYLSFRKEKSYIFRQDIEDDHDKF